MGKQDKRIIYYLLLIAVGALVVINWSYIIGKIGNLWAVASPVITAAIIAYILNILMVKFEKWLFSNPESKFATKWGRPISIFLSIVVILAVVMLAIVLVVPQLVELVTVIIEAIPTMGVLLQDWIAEQEKWFPVLGEQLENLNIDWGAMVRNTMNTVNAMTQSILTSAVSTVGNLFSSTMSFVLSFMLALYMLVSKEKLYSQFTQLAHAYLPHKVVSRTLYVLRELDQSFVNFITGEVIEAIILGVLVAVGMAVLRLPYAVMIGVVTGVLALIPLLGAYISAAIGFVLILVQSPVQALIFLVFIIVIQQLEGNFIYPKVVGDSIGLPGMWVLVSVTIGGGLWGIPGMLIGVPIAAAVYSILKKDVQRRQAENPQSFQEHIEIENAAFESSEEI